MQVKVITVYVVKFEEMGCYLTEVQYIGLNRQRASMSQRQAQRRDRNVWIEEIQCRGLTNAMAFVRTLDETLTIPRYVQTIRDHIFWRKEF